MKVLVGYATSEGQTRKVARHVADRLADAGHAVELLPLAEAEDVDLGRFDRIVLAASVHLGHYQPALAEFAAFHAAALREMPTLFLSVSLAAAGHDAEDWKGLDRVLAEFAEATGWSPARVEHVAGAYQPSRYDVLRRLAMRRIIVARDPGADPRADREYTDWPALDAALDGWIGAVAR